jgi:hypothetical protein
MPLIFYLCIHKFETLNKANVIIFSSYRWIEDGCTVSSLRTFILWSTLTPFSRQSKTMSHAIHGMKATCAAQSTSKLKKIHTCNIDCKLYNGNEYRDLDMCLKCGAPWCWWLLNAKFTHQQCNKARDKSTSSVVFCFKLMLFHSCSRIFECK